MAHEKIKKSILVVDDAPDTLELLKRNLTSQGYTVYTSSGVSAAIKILDATPVDLVITDLKMPEISGLDLVKHVRENFKNTEVMMITGYASVNGAVEAVKSGAEEYLAKPFTDEELFSAVRRAIDKLHLRRPASPVAQTKDYDTYGLLGKSDAMNEVFRAIPKISNSNANVLITGESGTGKELVARAIHYNSDRASAPFVPVNCGGIPEGLLESELFGYVKGAFTGATESRAGFFQTADGGTIFLDEIGEMSLSMQVKLLRVLQDREVCMVGAAKTRKVDVRVLAATNKDMFGLVKKGAFREDLFFRLHVITVSIPPLRDRKDDILFLAGHFACKYADEMGKATPRFSEKALEVIRDYNWPGNVRELENVIQRLIVMNEGESIEVPDLPSLMRFSALRNTGLTRSLAEVETEYIRNVLESVNGNKTRAAQILRIDRKTLREKLKGSES
ncbi:MAG: sigma-54-dependent Fis family transcriptional regulator [Candidatus Zixiibacteriota bacterium]|nr:MAG: sigma-54-dependent Fis family transcriptional regulator [candidate division Zixibacteria bacterium]